VFVTARSVMTADIISGGRMIFGIGVGWCREEFEIVGADFGTRGRRTTEMAAVLKKLWGQHVIEHSSDTLSFGPVGFEPKPVQRPGPPIIGSGLAEAALVRSARLDGVFLPTHDIRVVRKSLEKIHHERSRQGTTNEPYEVTTTCPQPVEVAAIEELRNAGVDRVVLYPDGMPLQAAGTVPVASIEQMRRHLTALASTLPHWGAGPPMSGT
jgi:alkanesulfonate monooxygenase SsuD/methylene tetrahydromethanopterin reductase-like flavin-dependent oxidoreductase (luciferase family)